MNTNKFVYFFVCLIISVIMCSCEYKVTSGEVVGKEYQPAYNTTAFMPIVISNGKTTTTTMVPYVIRYSDNWFITIYGYSEKDNKYIEETHRVTKEVYDSVEIGSYFEYNKKMEPSEPEYVKEKRE